MTTTDAATQSPLDSLLPIDELAHAIVGRCAKRYAADYKLLLQIRQFDERVDEMLDDANENDSTNPSAGGLLPILEKTRRRLLTPFIAERITPQN